MDAITIYPENKHQEDTLVDMLALMRLSFEKISLKEFERILPDIDKKKSLSSLLTELEEMIDMLDISQANSHRDEPMSKWEDVKKRLDLKHGVTE